MLYSYNEAKAELILNVYLQPSAKFTQIVGKHGDALKIKVKAPPLDGRANDELLEFLAKQFKLALSELKIIAGDKSRLKRVKVSANCTQLISYLKDILDE